MIEYADYFCQCEICFLYDKSIVQYQPVILNGVVIIKCPICNAIKGQTLIKR
jgi:hypothetical protein